MSTKRKAACIATPRPCKENAARKSALQHLTGKLFKGSTELLFTHLVSDQKLSKDQIQRMRDLLAENTPRQPRRRSKCSPGCSTSSWCRCCCRWRLSRRTRRASEAGHTRWIWITAIVASLVLPTLISSVAIELPDIVGDSLAEQVRGAAPGNFTNSRRPCGFPAAPKPASWRSPPTPHQATLARVRRDVAGADRKWRAAVPAQA